MGIGWRAVRRALTADWSLYICDEMNDEKTETVEYERLSPRPFGGEGGPQPALSPAGAGRVRASNLSKLNITIAGHVPWHARRDRLTKRASFARRRPRRSGPLGTDCGGFGSPSIPFRPPSTS